MRELRRHRVEYWLLQRQLLGPADPLCISPWERGHCGPLDSAHPDTQAVLKGVSLVSNTLRNEFPPMVG